jgi:hypothetical protein
MNSSILRPLRGAVKRGPRDGLRSTFTRREPVAALEYRLWVDAQTSATLERVELYSSVAIPHER